MTRTLAALVAAPLLLLAPPAAAQDAARTQRLEEQVRQLTGRVEELSFQLLQMEERLRKMQEDNEFRFQELEGDGEGEPDERGDAGTRDGRALARADAATTANPERPAVKEPKPAREKAKATLRFDDEGRLVAGPGARANAEPSEQRLVDLARPADPPFATVDEAAFAAAAFGATPNAVFARARELHRSERFAEAAKAFAAHVGAWPGDTREAEARYWHGDALFRAGEYYDAASTLLDAHNRFPKAPTAPDALLALGLSLAGLEQREVACATYAEVLKQYPQAERRLGAQVRAEQAAARC